MSQTELTRRDVLRAAGAGGLALALPAWAWADQPERRRPNILYIMTDDHAAHALSCYGSRINQTPHMDRIAREGMRFANCFCTNGICAPSRATILTGKYSHRNGILDNRQEFDGGQTTFPKLLQQAGYETALIGKWHLKTDPTGFDYWDILPGQGIYHDPDFISPEGRKKHSGYATDITTDKCVQWLAGRGRERPFALLCQHKAPHRPWEPDAKHARLYEGVDIPEPVTFNDDYATRCDAARQQAMTIERHLKEKDVKGAPPDGLTRAARKSWYYQRYIKDYLRCVASVDDNIGRLLDYLDKNDLTENTIVIYTSDQGFFLGDHGWYDKRFMYEEALRMPLLVRYPRAIKPGSVNEDLVLNIDFAPTFLDCAGVKPPAEMQGVSFQPLLSGQRPADWRTSMYYRYYENGHGEHQVLPHYGVRTRRHKLIHFLGGLDAWELYDLEKDPHELHNVYAEPAYASTVQELKAELARLQKQYGDTEEATSQPTTAP
ncbi:MAG: sulfatase [Phycisphaerae bacterium]|nr:sulfatase [Phycisphaerae bacterium]